MMPVIAIDRLCKSYGSVRAVVDLDISIGKGEIYALLGLNGAGKTTAIRTLLGMVRPSSGSARLFGRVVRPHAPAVWARVGYMVEASSAWPELTVRENLEIVRRLREIPESGVVDRAVGELGLSAYANRRAGTLSQGNMQRLALARALLHRPELLLLDEPANGLDPAGVVEIRELMLREVSNRGATILVSSHILAEVEKVATRIGIIHRGHMVDDFAAWELEGRLHRVLIAGTRDLTAAREVLRNVGIDATTRGDGCLQISAPDVIEHPEQVATLLVGSGQDLTHLEVQREGLESFFLRTVGGMEPAP